MNDHATVASAMFDRSLPHIEVPLDRLRRLDFDQYMRLASQGHFEGEHVELVDGLVTTMTPIARRRGMSTNKNWDAEISAGHAALAVDGQSSPGGRAGGELRA